MRNWYWRSFVIKLTARCLKSVMFMLELGEFYSNSTWTMMRSRVSGVSFDDFKHDGNHNTKDNILSCYNKNFRNIFQTFENISKLLEKIFENRLFLLK